MFETLLFQDVSSKIMSFSQQGPRAVCILSANGAISNVTLRQAATSGGTVTYEVCTFWLMILIPDRIWFLHSGGKLVYSLGLRLNLLFPHFLRGMLSGTWDYCSLLVVMCMQDGSSFLLQYCIFLRDRSQNMLNKTIFSYRSLTSFWKSVATVIFSFLFTRNWFWPVSWLQEI